MTLITQNECTRCLNLSLPGKQMRDLVGSNIILAWNDPTDDLDVVQLAVLVQIKIRVETEINHVILELAIAKLNYEVAAYRY